MQKTNKLKTKARKLLNHKVRTTSSIKLKELQINLIKIENTNEWTSEVLVTSKTLNQLQEYRAKTVINSTMANEFTDIDSDSTELYELEEQSYGTIEYLDVSTKDIDSDSTELYELEEQTIGTIEYLDDINNGTKLRKTSKNDKKKESIKTKKCGLKTRKKLYLFKCPEPNCDIRTKNHKELNQHYRITHKLLSKCNF